MFYQVYQRLNEITECSTDLLFGGLPVPGRLGAWKGVLVSKGLRVNFKTKMMISSENTGRVAIESKFRYAVCRKHVNINPIICQFCRCWVIKGVVVL